MSKCRVESSFLVSRWVHHLSYNVRCGRYSATAQLNHNWWSSLYNLTGTTLAYHRRGLPQSNGIDSLETSY